MKYLICTNAMDYRILLPYLTVGILYFTKGILGQARSLPVPCPPPFPDFEAIFAKTLRMNPRFKQMKNRLQFQINRPPNCSCSPALMGDIEGINQFRCERRTPILKVCPTTSTKLPTIVTEPSTIDFEASSTRPLPPSPTIRYTSGGDSPSTSAVSVDVHKTSSSDWDNKNPNVIDVGTTTPLVPLNPSGLPPSAKPVTTSDEGFTIVVIAVGAGVLLLIFLIGFLLLCRKRLCVGSGVLGAHQKREKLQRLRSDCQPISAISRGDTFEEGYAASMISSAGSVRSAVSSEYPKRGYVTNGRKWRPEFDSDTGSEKYSADSKYILLREDSSASALSFSNHYNTLHTIEHPHALMMGGFGESSTDVTLPRAASKKKKRVANGDISLDSNEDPMALMPSNSTFRRIQSLDSLNSIEIYDRVSKPRSFRVNGYANGHGPPAEHRMDNSEESDNASLDTIDKADEGLGVKPSGQDSAAALPQTHKKTGIINLSYQPDHRADDKSDPNWQKEVIDELKKISNENEKYDSLVNEKNAPMFGYENKAIDSSDSHLDPPSDFRDSRESEISVAVVQPLKHELPKSRRYSKKDSGNRSSWSPTAKKQPPPVARKPSNGFKSDPRRLSALDPIASAREEAIGGKVIEQFAETSSKDPMANGVSEPVLMNGHGPMVNGLEAGTDDEVGRVKKFVFDIQQKDGGLKPSAHVQPQVQRYGDTRL